MRFAGSSALAVLAVLGFASRVSAQFHSRHEVSKPGSPYQHAPFTTTEGETGVYWASESTCNLGHRIIMYMFSWGDGTFSASSLRVPQLGVGATKYWRKAGTFRVRVLARCAGWGFAVSPAATVVISPLQQGRWFSWVIMYNYGATWVQNPDTKNYMYTYDGTTYREQGGTGSVYIKNEKGQYQKP